MKKTFGFFAVLTVFLLGFSSCQKEVNQVEKTVATHTLKFVANAPLTKTTADINQKDKTVDYNWTKDDEGRFTVYEIAGGTYSAATETIGTINDDGTMSILASFKGDYVTGAQYIALLNTGIQTSQKATGTAYDELSDVLVSEKISSDNIEDQVLNLRFKRETAFALMTAKGLTEGTKIIGASITSDQILAAEYNIEKEVFNEEGAKTINISNDGEAISAIDGGNGNVFFAATPITDAHITVGVVTGDEEGKYVAAYEKKIADERSISFENGNVRPFNIGMNEVTEQTLNLTIDETTTASENELSWDRTFVSVVAAKANATTNANNYYPGTSGQTYKSTRFYKSSTLTFTQKIGVPIKKIEFSATSDGYATSLANSTWTNAQSSASGKTVTVTPINAFAAITATIGATCGFESIVITYGETKPATPHSVIISDAIEHGTVSADPTSATIGTEITLTATPATGYEFGEWSVTNASTSEVIAVEDNKFTMPDADVNVSATFKEEGREKVTTMSGTSDADIKFVTGSSSAEKAVWANSSPLTANNITLSGSVTSGTNYSYYDGTVVRFYTNNNLVITPSNDAVITKIEIVRQTTTGSNSGTINCSGLTASDNNTTTNTNVFTGETSSAVTFSVSAQARFTKIVVYSTPGKAVQTVTVSGDTTKKVYKAGDNFETAGLVATATYDDASTKDVTADVEWTVTPSPLTVGTTSVSVVAAYKGVSSKTYEIKGLTVTEPAELVSISVKTAPTKVTYKEGENFDPAGLVITRNYSDETSDEYAFAEHENDFTFNPALTTALATSNTNVTITYNGKSVSQEITVEDTSLKTMDEIFAAATKAGSNPTAVKIKFTNCVITGVKDNNAYLTDASGAKGLIIYGKDHEFAVGDKLNGKVNCKVQLYNGASELTELNSTTEGLTVTKDGTVTPQTISIANLSGVNTGAVISFSKLSYDGAKFTDGADSIQPYGAFMTLPQFDMTKKYNITGVFVQYKTTKEIAPRTEADIEEIEVPYIKATPEKSTAAAAGETISVTVETNVASWTVESSDPTNFAISGKTTNSFNVVVAENTDTQNDREATITVKAEGAEDAVFTLKQVKKGGSTGPAVGTVLWGENFAHFGTKTPSAAGTGTGTTIYGDATITYAQSSTNTKGYNENTAGGTAPELLLSKSNQTWTISGIPCADVTNMSLTFLSNKTAFAVSSTTPGITVTGSQKSWTIKNSGAKTFTLEIKNTSSKDNARIDNVELKVSTN